MPIPIVSPLWKLVDGVAWDTAINLQEMLRLGGRSWWRRLHWEAARHYAFDPPARVMLRESAGMPLPEGQYVYGETPGLSMLAMVRRVGVAHGDVLADLGCGRGLGAMAVGLELGIPVLGFEALPTMVERARSMTLRLPFKHPPQWIQGDFLQADWQGASIFYIASTTFDRGVMRTLEARLAEHIPANGRPLRVITLSQPLSPPFRQLARQRFPMTWGWNTVYFYERDEPAPRESSSGEGGPPDLRLPLTSPPEGGYVRLAGAPVPPSRPTDHHPPSAPTPPRLEERPLSSEAPPAPAPTGLAMPPLAPPKA